MLEMCRVLKPGGILVLTTDYAEKYYPPPGLWPSGSHRIYDYKSLNHRLIKPIKEKYNADIYDEFNFNGIDRLDLKITEPRGYEYTEIIVTLRKPEANND
jgi:ubiquinone/menaquinone biosynthesis C-methylase UbiE